MNIVLATNSRDRGSTSRTLEAWTRLLPLEGINPHVTVGGDGPLLSALRAAHIPTLVRPTRVVPIWHWPMPFCLAVARFYKTLRSARAELVHVNEHQAHLVPTYAAHLAKIPIITHLRFKPTPGMCRWIFGRGRVPARLFFTSRTQMHDSADAIRPMVPEERWRLIPNGLDVSTFGRDVGQRARLRSAWGLDDETFAIGTACAISPRKRLDHFIRLVARLRAHGIKVHGFIAGQAHFPQDARLVEELQRLACELQQRDAIHFLGYVEPVEPLYHAWDLCVSTSSYETFGMTICEAMSCRCPVLAYPGGSIAEVVDDSGVIVPDADEDALFDEALRLSQNWEAARVLGNRGWARVAATYDIRRIVPIIAREYREVIGSSRPCR